MTRIALLADTHNYLDENILTLVSGCHEIWHAGDFGNAAIAQKLEEKLPLRGVYGNIDGADIRSRFPLQEIFFCEDVKVMIRHIGGYPPKYNDATRKELAIHRPQLFISGHSHILKIMFDPNLQCLHMNPGAAGKQGWHQKRTLLRFTIDKNDIRDCEVVELGIRY